MLQGGDCLFECHVECNAVQNLVGVHLGYSVEQADGSCWQQQLHANDPVWVMSSHV
jgi:uncharacterized membrane protein